MYFFASDTTGEKDFEEFFTDAETLDMERFANIGVALNERHYLFGNTCCDECTVELRHREGSLQGWLADHGIAHDESGSALLHEQLDREIEREDGGHDS